LHRDLALLHRLQQRGLGLGRGPVHLVGDHDAGEDRSRPEREGGRRAVEHHRAHDVRGHQVGRELDALEAPPGPPPPPPPPLPAPSPSPVPASPARPLSPPVSSWARQRAISVFAVPGTPSISTCPSTRKAPSKSRKASSPSTSTRPTRSRAIAYSSWGVTPPS